MTNLVMLFVCLAAGMSLRAGKRLRENAHTTINGYIINIAISALILAKIHDPRLSSDLLWPVLMPWILFALGLLTFVPLARLLKFSKLTTGAVVAMQYGFNPALITLMVGIGITLSFFTLPLGYLALAPF